MKKTSDRNTPKTADGAKRRRRKAASGKIGRATAQEESAQASAATEDDNELERLLADPPRSRLQIPFTI